jgi:hypothetical protein
MARDGCVSFSWIATLSGKESNDVRTGSRHPNLEDLKRRIISYNIIVMKYLPAITNHHYDIHLTCINIFTQVTLSPWIICTLEFCETKPDLLCAPSMKYKKWIHNSSLNTYRHKSDGTLHTQKKGRKSNGIKSPPWKVPKLKKIKSDKLCNIIPPTLLKLQVKNYDSIL